MMRDKLFGALNARAFYGWTIVAMARLDLSPGAAASRRTWRRFPQHRAASVRYKTDDGRGAD